jgi:hypothetical protein
LSISSRHPDQHFLEYPLSTSTETPASQNRLLNGQFLQNGPMFPRLLIQLKANGILARI